jgi:hypothetical protein
MLRELWHLTNRNRLILRAYLIDSRSTHSLAFSKAMTLAFCSVLHASLSSPCKSVSDSGLPVDHQSNAMGTHRSSTRCWEQALL